MSSSDPRRDHRAVLPRQGWLHSEHYLNGKGKMRELAAWLGRSSLGDSCLGSQPEECSCLQTGASLVYQMGRRVGSLVMFIPGSCAARMRQAIAEVHGRGGLENVLAVWGIGDPLEDRLPPVTIWARQ